MYEWKDGKVCIPAKALYEDFKIITSSHFKVLCHRGHIKRVQRGGNGRIGLIDFHSLPHELKQEVQLHLGNPPVEKLNYVLNHYQEISEIKLFYEEFKLPDGRYLKTEHINEYTLNATVLEALKKAIAESLMTRSGRQGSKKIDWKSIANELKQLKLKREGNAYPYRHSLPESERRIRETYNKFLSEGYASLVPIGKFGNKNASKSDVQAQEALLVKLVGNGRNLNYRKIADLYNTVAEPLDWEEITDKAVEKWYKRNERLVKAGRMGTQYYKNKISMQVKRSKPTSPFYFWSADGWNAELYYNNGTTYTNSLMIVIIIDAFNGYPIGYAIGDRESSTLIIQAMRNALNHTKELFGQRLRTWQIQSDRFAKSVLTPYWETIAKTYTPAEAKNAKSKPIEPWFNHNMQRHCQDFINWSGYGIKASEDRQVNAEWLDKHKKQFPDKKGCIKQLEQVIHLIRQEKIDEYLKAYELMNEEDKLFMSDELFYYKFGEKTLPNKLNGPGLTPTINGRKYAFDCFDLNFRNHMRERWIVYYDPHDTSKALAVSSENEQLRFIVEEKYIQPMALRDRKEGDYEELERIRAFNRADQQEVINKLAESAECIKDLFESRKELENNPAAKFLITDNRGQHKKYLKPNPTDAEYEEIHTSSTTKEKERNYLKQKFNLNEYI